VVDNNPERRERRIWYDKELVLLGVLVGLVAQFLYNLFQHEVARFIPSLDFEDGGFIALLLALLVVLFGYGVARLISWAERGRPMANLWQYAISLWRIIIAISIIPFLLGAILLSVSPTWGFGLIALALGLIGAGLGFISEGLITEIRDGEVNQKIAVLGGITGDNGLRIVSDLEALRSYSKSIKKPHALKIQERGRIILPWMNQNTPAYEAQAREILNDILRPFNLNV
jgi:hypothetical protein